MNRAKKPPTAVKHRVMIVDDEEKIRTIYKKLLTLEDYEVFDAKDWEAATKLLASENIQAVLLDLNMPVVDGTALYEVIRRYYPKIKIIVTSAYPLEDQKHLVLEADDYFDKSHGTELLLEKIKNSLMAR